MADAGSSPTSTTPRPGGAMPLDFIAATSAATPARIRAARAAPSISRAPTLSLPIAASRLEVVAARLRHRPAVGIRQRNPCSRGQPAHVVVLGGRIDDAAVDDLELDVQR